MLVEDQKSSLNKGHKDPLSYEADSSIFIISLISENLILISNSLILKSTGLIE